MRKMVFFWAKAAGQLNRRSERTKRISICYHTPPAPAWRGRRAPARGLLERGGTGVPAGESEALYGAADMRRYRTGHHRLAGVRNDPCDYGPDLDADVRARRVRPHRARDHLLESRIRSRSPRLPIGGQTGGRRSLLRASPGHNVPMRHRTGPAIFAPENSSVVTRR